MKSENVIVTFIYNFTKMDKRLFSTMWPYYNLHMASPLTKHYVHFEFIKEITVINYFKLWSGVNYLQTDYLIKLLCKIV